MLQIYKGRTTVLPVLAISAAVTEHHRLGNYTEQTLFGSQFWRLGSHD
jgi:hypothetical protein